MMHAARRRIADLDGDLERRERELGAHLPADGVADDPARPGIQDHGQIDEAGGDAKVGDVGDPQLIGAARRHVLGKIDEDRLVMVAVRGSHEPTPRANLQALLAHDPSDPLAIDQASFGAQLGRNAAIAVTRELGTDLAHTLCQLGIGTHGFRLRFLGSIVVGAARQFHDPASFADAAGLGPLTIEELPLLGRLAKRCPFLMRSSSMVSWPTLRSSAAILAW